MNREPRCAIYKHIRLFYLKGKAFLLKTAACFRRKNGEYLLGRILRNFDARILEAELSRFNRSFAYLLEPTTLFLQGVPTAYFSTAESLDKAWAYCLNDDTACLQHLYTKLHQYAKGDALRLWIVFLRKHGFSRVLEGEDIVEVSQASRKYFDNTLGIKDGTILPIESHPWTYAGNLVVGGIVKR